MGVLRKRIKATTLMETLVATSIIIIVFVVASLVLNNTYRSIVKRDSFAIDNRIEKLEYLYKNDKLQLPYNETYQNYELFVERITIDDINYVSFETVSSTDDKITIKYFVDGK